MGNIQKKPEEPKNPLPAIEKLFSSIVESLRVDDEDESLFPRPNIIPHRYHHPRIFSSKQRRFFHPHFHISLFKSLTILILEKYEKRTTLNLIAKNVKVAKNIKKLIQNQKTLSYNILQKTIQKSLVSLGSLSHLSASTIPFSKQLLLMSKKLHTVTSLSLTLDAENMILFSTVLYSFSSSLQSLKIHQKDKYLSGANTKLFSASTHLLKKLQHYTAINPSGNYQELGFLETLTHLSFKFDVFYGNFENMPNDILLAAERTPLLEHLGIFISPQFSILLMLRLNDFSKRLRNLKIKSLELSLGKYQLFSDQSREFGETLATLPLERLVMNFSGPFNEGLGFRSMKNDLLRLGNLVVLDMTFLMKEFAGENTIYLGYLFKYTSMLKVLKVKVNSGGVDNLAACSFGLGLEKLKGIKELKIVWKECQTLKDSGIKSLINSFKSLVELESLEFFLSDNYIVGDTLIEFGLMLPRLNRLKIFIFHHFPYWFEKAPQGIMGLAKGISLCRGLNVLSIHTSKYPEDQAVEYFVKGLRELTELEELDYRLGDEVPEKVLYEFRRVWYYDKRIY